MGASPVRSLSSATPRKRHWRGQVSWLLGAVVLLTIAALYWNQKSQATFEDPIEVAKSFALYYLAGDRPGLSRFALPTVALPRVETEAQSPDYEAVTALRLRTYQMAKFDDDFVVTIASPRLSNVFEKASVVLVLHLKPDPKQLSYFEKLYHWAMLRGLARVRLVPTRWKVARVLLDTDFHNRRAAELKRVEDVWRREGERFWRDLAAKAYEAAMERAKSWESKSPEEWQQWARIVQAVVDTWAYEEGTRQFTEVLRTIAQEESLLVP